jgi:hypothetical protein
MKTSKQEVVSEELSEKELIKRGKDYIALDAVSRWVDDEFFKAESPYSISDKFWRGSQNNLRRLKPVTKDLEDFKTDVSKAWKKNFGFDEALYEKGRNESGKKEGEKRDEKAIQYVLDVDTAYKLHMGSEEILKEFDAFYRDIPAIDFYKLEASIVETLEIPFDFLYLIEKYYV